MSCISGSTYIITKNIYLKKAIQSAYIDLPMIIIPIPFPFSKTAKSLPTNLHRPTNNKQQKHDRRKKETKVSQPDRQSQKSRNPNKKHICARTTPVKNYNLILRRRRLSPRDFQSVPTGTYNSAQQARADFFNKLIDSIHMKS